MSKRQYNPFDELCMNFDQGLRTVFGKPQTTGRANPAQQVDENELSGGEREASAGMMRVNHCGEVCAQALYQGQALTARLPDVRESMQQAAAEENDHLAWCEQRLNELGSHTSYLNPLWYAGSYAIGAFAGWAGDKWSLGFVAETEKQVVRHLDGHLERMSEQDGKSRAIIEQMKIDEQHHATTAQQAGGAELPGPIKQVMKITSKLMTRSAYYF